MKHLAQCSSLETLDLDYRNDLTKSAEFLSATCSGLLTLRLCDATLQPSPYMIITCTNLKKLNLDSSNANDMHIAHIAERCTQLEGVWLKFTIITDFAVQVLATYCKKITILDTSYTVTTDNSLKTIAEMLPNIRELKVACCNVTNNGITLITSKCRELKTLDLSGTHITDASLTLISTFLTKLESLSIPLCLDITPVENGKPLDINHKKNICMNKFYEKYTSESYRF